MIHRIKIAGYRCFSELDFAPNPRMNIVCGANESGKSTLLEAIALALTGRINGRWAREELNPYWFNRVAVDRFFSDRAAGVPAVPPEISIELYLSRELDSLQPFRGVHNSLGEDWPGIRMHIAPSPDYADEFAAYLGDSPPAVLPVEFYEVAWRDFSLETLSRRPKVLATAFIDSRTIRSTSGVDHHTREMLSEHLEAKERATLSIAHRRSKQGITDGPLRDINTTIAEASSSLHHKRLGLQMDQSARTSWETGIVPQVEDVPFAMAGQGQQAMIKVALAMSRTTSSSTFVLVEEPENHLSHTSLRRLVGQIQHLAAEHQQIFLATHSSFVLNRLGLDKLLLLHDASPLRLSAVSSDTIRYFRKLANYDTLRLALAEKLVLLEGPSDAILLERAFKDATQASLAQRGIDVITMNGLSFRRALEVCAGLGRQALALQDNDGQEPEDVRAKVESFLGRDRELLVSDPGQGRTLEPQIANLNDPDLLRRVLDVGSNVDLVTWMSQNKTEAALRIHDSRDPITYPKYFKRAISLLR